jgi:hypothetical protein
MYLPGAGLNISNVQTLSIITQYVAKYLSINNVGTTVIG